MDGKGNVTEVRRTNAVIVATYTYAPFGNIITNTGTYAQPFRFQTKLAHGKSGLGYWGYRWYEPRTGRWISRDGLGEAGGINLYEYCGGAPLSFVDPLGLFWEEFAFWNPESAVGRQFVSIGDAMGGSAAWVAGYHSGARNVLQEAVSGSGQAILDEECAGKGARIAYWGAIGISAAADISAGALIGLEAAGVSEIGSANMGWRGGEITFTRPGALTPDWRFNPFGGSGYGPHYHRRGPGGIKRHRPWQPGPGGFPGRL